MHLVDRIEITLPVLSSRGESSRELVVPPLRGCQINSCFEDVHGLRQNVSVTHGTPLFGEPIVSTPAISNLLLPAFFLDSLKPDYSRESSTSTYSNPASKLERIPALSSLTLWYPRHKLQYRIGLFYGAASLAGAFSGILAYGISFMSGAASKLGWSWIFVCLTESFMEKPY